MNPWKQSGCDELTIRIEMTGPNGQHIVIDPPYRDMGWHVFYYPGVKGKVADFVQDKQLAKFLFKKAEIVLDEEDWQLLNEIRAKFEAKCLMMDMDGSIKKLCQAAAEMDKDYIW